MMVTFILSNKVVEKRDWLRGGAVTELVHELFIFYFVCVALIFILLTLELKFINDS